MIAAWCLPWPGLVWYTKGYKSGLMDYDMTNIKSGLNKFILTFRLLGKLHDYLSRLMS